MGRGYPIERIKGVDGVLFNDVREIRAAVPAGLLAWGVSAFSNIDLARRNFADGSLLSVVGTPDVQANYTRYKGATNFLRSGAIETNEFSIAIIGRTTDTTADNAHHPTFAGSFRGGTDVGCLMDFSADDVARMQAYQAGGTSKASTLGVGDSSKWKCYFGIITAGDQVSTFGGVQIYNDTDGTSGATPGTFTAARQCGVNPICFGSSQSLTFTGLADIYHFACWNRALTAQDRVNHWTQLRTKWMPVDGIVENG